jgi:glycosyltransferase involved in cell wall biosynthesis
MRILMLSLLYPPIQVGGAEKAANLLAEALVRAGHQVSVISLHPGKDEVVEEMNGVRVYRLPLDNLYWPSFGSGKGHGPVAKLLWHLRDTWNPGAAVRVGRILDIEKPEVVHSHVITGFSVSVWREVKKRKIRLVHTIHDYYLLCIRSILFRQGRACEQQCFQCRLGTAPAKKLSHSVDHVVAVSRFVLDIHRKFGHFNQVPGSVVYNIQAARPAAAMERRAGETKLVFGYIGMISEAKGLRTLLSAMQSLNDPDWRLRIAGAGADDYVNELKQQFADPRIEWLGYTASQPFFQSIDVLVVPSLWQDPLPYVVIECFAAGKALIGAQSGGIPELGRLGRRVATYPAGDTTELARLMNEAMADCDAWRSGGFADSGSMSRFSEHEVTANYMKLYGIIEK